MSFARIKYGLHNGLYNYSEFVVDDEDDLAILPTGVSVGHSDGIEFGTCSVGSIATVVNQRKKYQLNNANEWKIMVNYAAGGGGGGTASVEVEDDGDGNVSIL